MTTGNNDDFEVYEWEALDDEEFEITAEDQENSEDLSFKQFLGVGLYEAVSSEAIEGSNYEYCPWVAHVKYKLIDIIEAHMPLIDDKKKPVKKNGEVVKRQRVLTDKEKELFSGEIGAELIDDIALMHPEEKPGTKNRRLNAAKCLGIMTKDDKTETRKMWRDVPGKKVIITTVVNGWKDKETDEWRTRGIKIPFTGYKAVNIKKTEEVEEEFPDI